MLPELADPNPTRVRFLIARYRAEEATLTQALDEQVALRDRIERTAASECSMPGARAAMRRHSQMLDRCCDDLATELLHVRLALLGATEELERTLQNMPRPIAHDTGDSQPKANSSPGLCEAFTIREELLGA